MNIQILETNVNFNIDVFIQNNVGHSATAVGDSCSGVFVGVLSCAPTELWWWGVLYRGHQQHHYSATCPRRPQGQPKWGVQRGSLVCLFWTDLFNLVFPLGNWKQWATTFLSSQDCNLSPCFRPSIPSRKCLASKQLRWSCLGMLPNHLWMMSCMAKMVCVRVIL